MNIKRISNLVWIGIFLSAIWATSSSFLYFSELRLAHNSYPNYSANDRGVVIKYLNNFFGWRMNVWELVSKADVKKNDEDSNDKSWITKTPVFSLLGYLKLVLFPILIGWLAIVATNILILPYRRDIWATVKTKFEDIDPIARAFIFLTLMGSCLVHALSVDYMFMLIAIVIGICFVGWILLKKALYQLVYLVTRAIEDAREHK